MTKKAPKRPAVSARGGIVPDVATRRTTTPAEPIEVAAQNARVEYILEDFLLVTPTVTTPTPAPSPSRTARRDARLAAPSRRRHNLARAVVTPEAPSVASFSVASFSVASFPSPLSPCDAPCAPWRVPKGGGFDSTRRRQATDTRAKTFARGDARRRGARRARAGVPRRRPPPRGGSAGTVPAREGERARASNEESGPGGDG